ncbi:MAG: hypothetical protein TQ37_10565 [Candidatus Synechococcus spongiarum 15L]|uniref:Uncharacterized protein n=1 Tax=Candidatus Synechococcus spongiarum 15L TaxID=1608419 RepID=A0A0G8ARJ8_9SYNE|nr:MAG: hypothetical protein TQ37_10565 [Candidatus Synechococcus spongiarum 15L]
MKTAEATFNPESTNAATRLFIRVAELNLPGWKPASLGRLSWLSWAPKPVVRLLARLLLTLFDVWLLLATMTDRRKIQRLVLRTNRTTFDDDEGLAALKRLAKSCGDLVQRLDGCYEQRHRLGRRWRLLPLNGLVLHQLENLICEVEDVGETAALSASPEFTAGIMKQLTAHGIA